MNDDFKNTVNNCSVESTLKSKVAVLEKAIDELSNDLVELQDSYNAAEKEHENQLLQAVDDVEDLTFQNKDLIVAIKEILRIPWIPIPMREKAEALLEK